MLPNPELGQVTIGDYLKIIKKRIILIIACLIIIPTAQAIRLFNIKPVYKATASLLIEKNLPKITKFEETDSRSDSGYLQTQLQILTSTLLTEKVYSELGLAKDPYFASLKDPIQELNKKVSVEPVRSSSIVQLSVDDENPLRASSIANGFAKIFIEQDIEARNSSTRQATGWLEGQLEDIKKKVEDSERVLNDYIQLNKIVTMPDIETKTESLIDSLKQEKSKLETQLAEASKRYKEKHPTIIALRAQLESVVKKVEQETNSFLELKQKTSQYGILKRDVDTTQQLYLTMLTRAKETAVSQKLESTGIRIIDYAKPPEFPYKPEKKKEMFFALFASLALGFGIVFALEFLDSTIHNAEDVSHYVDLPFLGYTPSVRKEAKTDMERVMLCYKNPRSPVAESFRAIRTSVLFASPEDRALKSILITSTVPGEGKSFISPSLSIVFSQLNEQVVLLDVDMRRPTIHKRLGVEQMPGISNYLIGNAKLEQIIKPTSIRNLSVIPAGSIPPNPSELLSSKKIRSLFDELKGKFSRIIVDSPPVLSCPDSLLLGNIIDGVILVIKGGSTRLDEVLRSKSKLLEAKSHVIGVILNDLEPEKEDKYYYYHYSYVAETDKK